LTASQIAAEGVCLAEALTTFAAFAQDNMIWSWGKDELNLMAISPWIAGIPAPLSVQQFGNACNLLLKAGVPYADVHSSRSHTLVHTLASHRQKVARMMQRLMPPVLPQ
jgi:hypothetical protein